MIWVNTRIFVCHISLGVNVGLLLVPASIFAFPLFGVTKNLVSFYLVISCFAPCCDEGFCSACSRLYRAWQQCFVCAQLWTPPPRGEVSPPTLAVSSPGCLGTVLKASYVRGFMPFLCWIFNLLCRYYAFLCSLVLLCHNFSV